MSKPIHILFLCVANSARSQLAEGLAKSIFGDSAIIQSAGSEPSGKVQPLAVEVLQEEGIDISKNWSKSIDQLAPELLSQFDYVITLCTEEVCPALPSKAKRLHWPIPDPTRAPGDGKAKAFMEARKLIRQKVEAFRDYLQIAQQK